MGLGFGYMLYTDLLIIGNRPYAMMNKKCVPIEYHEFFSGRPNMYIIFILKCLKMLPKNTGILAFVLPTNAMSCIYYCIQLAPHVRSLSRMY